MNFKALLSENIKNRETARRFDTTFCSTAEQEAIFNEFYMDDVNDENCKAKVNTFVNAVFMWQFIADLLGIKYRKLHSKTFEENLENKLNSVFEVNGVTYKPLDLFLMTDTELEDIRVKMVGSSEIVTPNYNFKCSRKSFDED